MTRRAIASIGVLAAALTLTPRASAHRLDEFLQATRIALAADTVALDIDLTAGASVAAEVFSTIDSDRDGDVSAAEADAYAQRVLGALVVSIDGRPAALTLTGRRFPSFGEMRGGVGTIRLSATAAVQSAAGVHQISYVNRFMPQTSVYLANALTPSDSRIEIAAQRRDWLQRGLTVEYRVQDQARTRIGWSVVALATAGLLPLFRRGRPSA